MTERRILKIRNNRGKHWVGDGFPVSSMFSYGRDEHISPFLLLDYAGPADFAPSDSPRGVGEHPHRGFETVTIVYDGEVQHRDNAGNHGRIGPGDVQWMTAARGVLHEEMHSEAFTRRGGRLEMVQLWVNLPARHKMAPPAYQEIRHAQIPVAAVDGGELRVIAGEFGGLRGAARSFTPITLLDIRLEAGRSLTLPLEEGHHAALLTRRGSIRVADEGLEEGELAIFAPEGDRITLTAVEDARLLFMAGEPIDEPIVGAGPFVMNTTEEIHQAYRDFRDGRL